jgi:hypothetical protein
LASELLLGITNGDATSMRAVRPAADLYDHAYRLCSNQGGWNGCMDRAEDVCSW